MTMPGARKNYAGSKYLLSFIIVTISWLIAVVMQFSVIMIKKEAFEPFDLMGEYLLYLPIFLIICSIIIPIDLKYGVEKGRIIFIFIFVAASLIIMAGTKPGRSNGPNTGMDANAFLNRIGNIPSVVVASVLCAVALIIAFISIRISGSIMKKKEY